MNSETTPSTSDPPLERHEWVDEAVSFLALCSLAAIVLCGAVVMARKVFERFFELTSLQLALG